MKTFFIILLFSGIILAQECPVKGEHAVRWTAQLSAKDTSEFIYRDSVILQVRYKERILGGTCRYCQEKLTKHAIEVQDTVFIREDIIDE